MSKAYAFVPDGPPRLPRVGDWFPVGEPCGSCGRLPQLWVCAQIDHDAKSGFVRQCYRQESQPPAPPKPELPVLVPTGRKVEHTAYGPVEVLASYGTGLGFWSIGKDEFRPVPLAELREVPETTLGTMGHPPDSWVNGFSAGYRACLAKLGIKDCI
jgi:hypothetical protein